MCQLPVIDNRNKPIINTRCIRIKVLRCLAKAVAMHGLGLYIYAGEDLPESFDARRTTSHQSAKSRYLKAS